MAKLTEDRTKYVCTLFIVNVVVALKLAIMCSFIIYKFEKIEDKLEEYQILTKSEGSNKSTKSPVSFNDQGEVTYPVSCYALKKKGFGNGIYLIDPDGPSTGLDPFLVVCDMTSDLGITVIHHDKEEEGFVKGYELPGSFHVNVTYDVEAEQIEAIKKVSTTCKQFIKYTCIHSVIHGQSRANQYWISVNGTQMVNWGGIPTGTRGCKCWITSSCADVSKRCNCDSNDKILRKDEGYLTDKETLPVSQLRFGDTGDSGENGIYLLGPLQCT